MARLIDLRQIQQEKINRCRTWIFGEIAAGRFPKPLPLKSSKNLWDEESVDRWLTDFIARVKQSGQDGENARATQTQKARAERKARAAQARVAA